MSFLLRSITRLRRAFSASKAFVWRTGSPHQLHGRGCCVGLRRQSPQRAQQQQQQRCCIKVIDNTHCCHRMTVRVAGGRRTGCATLSRCEQQQQQQQQQHSSSQASIGAVVGCDRVFCGVVRDAVGFKNFSIEQSEPRTPLNSLSTGCADRIARSKKLDRKGTFSTA